MLKRLSARVIIPPAFPGYVLFSDPVKMSEWRFMNAGFPGFHENFSTSKIGHFLNAKTSKCYSNKPNFNNYPDRVRDNILLSVFVMLS